jgi:hypothetical protein
VNIGEIGKFKLPASEGLATLQLGIPHLSAKVRDLYQSQHAEWGIIPTPTHARSAVDASSYSKFPPLPLLAKISLTIRVLPSEAGMGLKVTEILGPSRRCADFIPFVGGLGGDVGGGVGGN